MRRTDIILIWLCVAAAMVILLREPARCLFVMVRLYREELRPPLLVPVKGVPRSALAESWGAARSGGRQHQGIDIFAQCGRPVLSATEGIIFSVGHNTLGGQVVWVLGPGGTFHYYAHLGGFAGIRRWDHVMPGTILGSVGRTGNAARTPCHLHYGIYREGEAQDPYPLLAAQ